MTLAEEHAPRFLRDPTSKGNLDLLLVSFGASLLAMPASQNVLTETNWTLEGSLESK